MWSTQRVYGIRATISDWQEDITRGVIYHFTSAKFPFWMAKKVAWHGIKILLEQKIIAASLSGNNYLLYYINFITLVYW